MQRAFIHRSFVGLSGLPFWATANSRLATKTVRPRLTVGGYYVYQTDEKTVKKVMELENEHLQAGRTLPFWIDPLVVLILPMHSRSSFACH